MPAQCPKAAQSIEVAGEPVAFLELLDQHGSKDRGRRERATLAADLTLWTAPEAAAEPWKRLAGE
jgi:hypothetical protein